MDNPYAILLEPYIEKFNLARVAVPAKAENPKRQRAIEMRTGPVYMTLQQIGDELGVTREMVRQYTKGIERTPFAYKHLCKQCGARVNASAKTCPTCFQAAHSPIMLTCVECGVSFSRRRAEVTARRPGRGGYKTNNVFCGRVCMGRYAAKHFGLTAHPENTRRHRPIKQEQIRWLALKGYDLGEMARILNALPRNVASNLDALNRKDGKDMAWINLKRYQAQNAVTIVGKKTPLVSFPVNIWQGVLPQAYDVLVDTERCLLRIQDGSNYKGYISKTRIRIGITAALKMLNVNVSIKIALPFTWTDAGLVIDLSQWR